MTCWLMYLKRVSDLLRTEEANPARRKALAIDLLKEYEREIGHDSAKIGLALDRDGQAGLLQRARKRKQTTREDEKELEDQLEQPVSGGTRPSAA